MMRTWLLLVTFGCGGSDSPALDSAPSDDAPLDSPPGDGPPTGPVDDGHSGTRLKRVGWQTADGFFDHQYWRDTLLDVTCSFVTVADGSSRCGPRPSYTASMRYRDAACTDRLLHSQNPYPANATFFSSDSLCGPLSPTCGPSSWKKTTTVATPAAVYRSDPTNGCVAALTTGVFFEATQILPAQMVGETITLEPTPGRLTTRVRTTDDGGREFIQVFDPTLNEHCVPHLLADEKSHCAPLSSTRSGNDFSDAACTTEALRFAATDPEAARRYRLNYVTRPSRCPELVSFDRVAPHSGAVYTQNLQQCVLAFATAPPGLVFNVVGAPLASSAMLTEVSRSVSPGTTRVRVTYGNYEDGSVGRKRMLWDTVHQHECKFTDDPMTGVACVPREYLDFDGVYADAGCTQMIALNPHPCPASRLPKFARYGNHNGRYHRVVGGLALTAAYAGAPGSCTQISFPAGAHAFALDSTPITDWDAGTITVEP